jgi:hypothetical protein
LTVGYPGGITKQFSIRPEMKPQVERWLNNYQLLKRKLEEICELNHVLIRRRVGRFFVLVLFHLYR